MASEWVKPAKLMSDWTVLTFIKHRKLRMILRKNPKISGHIPVLYRIHYIRDLYIEKKWSTTRWVPKSSLTSVLTTPETA